ncbi:MAG: flagellar brake protein [Selenomonadaceae bacterium]
MANSIIMGNNIIKAEAILKIGQRLSFFSDNDSQNASRIEDILKDELIVAMPMDDKGRPVIPIRGERLYGAAYDDKCQYRFFSTLKNKGMHDGIPCWWIEKPEKVERHQNREFVRVRVNLPMQVQLMDDDGGFLPPQMVTVLDLSGSGLAFNSEKYVRVESQVIMEIRNLPNIGTLRVMGRVMRCIKVDPMIKESPYRVGVRMLDLDRPTRNRLVHYIFGIQRQELKKGLDTTGVKG